MAKQQTQVEQAPAGNGTARPYQVRFNGELLRTKGGVARRFKTEAAAQKALNAATRRPNPDKPYTTDQMIAMFREVLDDSPASQVRRAA
jgi:hypothetical protein